MSDVARLYDATAGYWDSFVHRAFYERAYTRLFEQLRVQGWIGEPKHPARGLDCGTGSGLLLTSLMNATGGRFAPHGIDISAKLLDHARRRLARRGAGPRLAVADVCALPFRDGQMDLVVSALVLEHIANPVDALKEMARVARPNAGIVLITTRPHAPDVLFRLAFRYRHYRIPEMLDWMRQAGIRDISRRRLAGIARWLGHAYVGRTPS